MTELSLPMVIRRLRRFVAIKPGTVTLVKHQHRLDLQPHIADAMGFKEEATLAERMRDETKQ